MGHVDITEANGGTMVAVEEFKALATKHYFTDGDHSSSLWASNPMPPTRRKRNRHLKMLVKTLEELKMGEYEICWGSGRIMQGHKCPAKVDYNCNVTYNEAVLREWGITTEAIDLKRSTLNADPPRF